MSRRPRKPRRAANNLRLETLERRELFSLTPVGGEFQPSGLVKGDQITTFHSPDSVAANAQGASIAVWTDLSAPGGGDVYAQRFVLNDPVGPAFLVHESTAGRQVRPAVAMDENGDFAVAWADADADGSSYGVFVRRFTAAGVAKGPSALVNVRTEGSQNRPSIAMDADGDFAVAWADSEGDFDGYGVYVRRYSAAGAPTTNPQLVNRAMDGVQSFPSLAMHPDGELLVAWTSADSGGDATGVVARRYDAAGIAVEPEFQVNQSPVGAQTFASAAYNAAEGRFAVAWTGPDAGGVGVFARSFNADGTPVADEQQISHLVDGTQMLPDLVAPYGDEGYAATWSDHSSGQWQVFARRLDSGAKPVEAAVLVHEPANADRSLASIAASADYFHVVYSGPGIDGSGRGVALRLLGEGAPPVAAAGGIYQIAEGGLLQLNAGDSLDPDGKIVQYLWDVNNDGVFDRSSPSPQASFKWGELTALGVDDGPQGYPIRLAVVDDTGLSDEATATVFVTNTPPIRAIDGPALALVGSSPVFSFSPIYDPGDDVVAFMTVDWGDGETTTYAPDAAQIEHTYTSTGSKTIRASLTDDDGFHQSVATHSITIFSLVVLPPGPFGVLAAESSPAPSAGGSQGMSLLEAFVAWKYGNHDDGSDAEL